MQAYLATKMLATFGSAYMLTGGCRSLQPDKGDDQLSKYSTQRPSSLLLFACLIMFNLIRSYDNAHSRLGLQDSVASHRHTSPTSSTYFVANGGGGRAADSHLGGGGGGGSSSGENGRLRDCDTAPERIWSMFNPVEGEAVVNALRRWQCSFGFRSRRIHNIDTILDPYVRLILDRCLPASVERQLCSEPLDALLNAVIAVRTSVIDESLMRWSHQEGVLQLINVASGFDTRAWRLRWPARMKIYEIDSATVQAQKSAALGNISTSCTRAALVGGVFNLGHVLKRLTLVGYDPTKPTLWLVEDVVEYLLPAHTSYMFAIMAAHCAPGSRMVASLSDVKLRDLLRRYGRTAHLVEDFEPPGIVLNRICAAGWHAEVLLPGQLEDRFDVDLHNCLYLVHGTRL
ncbi:hypothetical protein VOLCADRAFT_88831 [Volvox carteri f. nagariensis]|uniref:S-adenosyl-L-methionine-dependent methyltransferase n=1 Tax=Volvox carteri f. nagariensis TaxID=3068 RepID=D8TQ27_VOLCA|nr:uncharacterized protein VOLCADRAFT_88831 [Volvox carteri f. nagariensis]EFJ50330.1 hypothetical protein VOLCADRAFT_88831 [Volvox carteri f. nagariensis]|eukprot:XP_002948455.1 hypothetical protein VOLCADRAFT_88831 [Volvox carteri f. nagariensis]